MFVNRKQELQFLREEYKKNRYSFVVLYGRRRVGKTELVKEFIKNKPCIYFLASQEPSAIQLQRLIKRTAAFFNERTPAINDWLQAMDYIGEKLQQKSIILVIDEFSYLVESNNSVPSFFQALVDQYLKHSGSMLILSGSSIGFMETKVLGHKSPLYWRRTGQIDLEPFDFEKISLIVKEGIENRILANAVFGNMPMYLNFYENKSIENNILDNIMDKNSFLYKEPEMILKQEFREPGIYMSIIGAIASGKTRLNQISQAVKIQPGTLSKYLDNLIKIRLIEREVCITERQKKSKKTQYRIKDSLFRFWFRFIESNLSDVETNPRNYLKNTIIPELPSFVSETFESVCKEFIRKKTNYPEAGRWWHGEKEIDIVGLNKKENKILFAECKWKDNVNPEEVLTKLKEKATSVRWGGDKRKEEFFVFAKSFRKKTAYSYDLKDLEKFFPS